MVLITTESSFWEQSIEIFIGTGDNLPFLIEGIESFGLDISFGMLKACQKNLKK